MEWCQKLPALKLEPVRCLPFWLLALQFAVFWLTSLVTVLVATQSWQKGLFMGCVTFVWFLICTLHIWLWRKRVSEQFDSIDKRLTALTAELTELKSSKLQ